MKRYLIFCNTYLQLIIAMHMKLTMFCEDQVSVVLSDQTGGMREVSEKLKREIEIFSEVFYFETKDYCAHKRGISYFQDIIHSVFGDKKFSVFKNRKYDEIIYYNLDFALLAIYNIIEKNNPKVDISRYEESILSYEHSFLYPRMKLIMMFRSIIRRKNIVDNARYFYCFYPTLYKGNLKTKKIPMICEDEKRIKQLLERCFEIQLEGLEYSQKYIFFTSVYDFEGENSIGEFDAVCKIANLVGKNNLLIKQHPRDARNLYRENGFLVDKNSSIPWEAIQFEIDISDKILLTVNSTSILSSALLFKKGAESYFVYRLCDLSKNSLAQESVEAIEKLLENRDMTSTLKSVAIIHNVKEILH